MISFFLSRFVLIAHCPSIPTIGLAHASKQIFRIVVILFAYTMYPSEGGSDEERPWTPWGFGARDDDRIAIPCGDDRVSLIATRTRASSLPGERFSSGWEISCRERRNELVVTRQFGLVDTRENAVQFLNECRAAINRAVQRGESIDSVVVTSIVDELATDCDVPIMRPPEGIERTSRETINS
jgi:hypothetical protein